VHRARGRGHAHHRASLSGGGVAAGAATPYELSDLAGMERPLVATGVAGAGATASLLPPAKASREFGPEQALAAAGSQSKAFVHAGATAAESRASIARSASFGGTPVAGASGGDSSGRGAGTGEAPEPDGAGPSGQASADSAAAEREFSPG
jgi:hypothetical protein